MTAQEDRIPVLIVGAGGADLSLALLLRQQDIPSMLVERRSDISWVPRARNLNFRTLEVFRGLGLEGEVVGPLCQRTIKNMAAPKLNPSQSRHVPS